MNNINRFCVMGRLVRDPELKELESGHKVANITIAVDRNYKDKEGNKITDFLNYSLWDQDAERICEFSKKGAMIYLEGSITNKEVDCGNGKKIYTFSPIVNKYQHITNAKNMTEESAEVKVKSKKKKGLEVAK